MRHWDGLGLADKVLDEVTERGKPLSLLARDGEFPEFRRHADSGSNSFLKVAFRSHFIPSMTN